MLTKVTTRIGQGVTRLRYAMSELQERQLCLCQICLQGCVKKGTAFQDAVREVLVSSERFFACIGGCTGNGCRSCPRQISCAAGILYVRSLSNLPGRHVLIAKIDLGNWKGEYEGT
jgi:hypothetical protein